MHHWQPCMKKMSPRVLCKLYNGTRCTSWLADCLTRRTWCYSVVVEILCHLQQWRRAVSVRESRLSQVSELQQSFHSLQPCLVVVKFLCSKLCKKNFSPTLLTSNEYVAFVEGSWVFRCQLVCKIIFTFKLKSAVWFWCTFLNVYCLSLTWL